MQKRRRPRLGKFNDESESASWHSGCLNEALRVELEPFSGPNNRALRYTPGIGKCNAVTEKKRRKFAHKTRSPACGSGSQN